nr:Uma2 family endonuclease [Candidatus Sigynarchaeum springense]
MSKHLYGDHDDTSMAGENPPVQEMSRRARIEADIPDGFDPHKPRLGRRESEPHSAEVTYLYDVLRSNFPQDRVTWDLHHYFIVEGEEIDVVFDVSLFKGMSLPVQLSSYRAAEFGGRVPDLAINVMSKSTWRSDVGEHVDLCHMLKIPVYVIYAPFHVASRPYKPPFLRAYVADERGEYQARELRDVALKSGKEVNWDATIDCGGHLPFKLGLQELEGAKHEKGWQLYRLVIINPRERTIFRSKLEMEHARADQEKARADKEKARADQEKARADRAEEELARLRK